MAGRALRFQPARRLWPQSAGVPGAHSPLSHLGQQTRTWREPPTGERGRKVYHRTGWTFLDRFDEKLDYERENLKKIRRKLQYPGGDPNSKQYKLKKEQYFENEKPPSSCSTPVKTKQNRTKTKQSNTKMKQTQSQAK
eukprot:gnl/MRDRNA2_/MRDRNA2_145974_c0_seq1.p1 gnl/MRDRNA2_/MRDRNA2_145974_c0~~gnl/MRDRNA2_/MRDRNA2_145974_c0_seq1.p1  ORF type:complete len:154 (-),score=19.58 gnl/MRDRNA2_/MRDRNA2_145974_c0_seq1:68-481(-)